MTMYRMLDIYYLSFPHDRLPAKFLVYGLFTLEIIQTIIITHDAFAIFGFGFGNALTLDEAHLLWFGVPTMSGVGEQSNSLVLL